MNDEGVFPLAGMMEGSDGVGWGGGINLLNNVFDLPRSYSATARPLAFSRVMPQLDLTINLTRTQALFGSRTCLLLFSVRHVRFPSTIYGRSEFIVPLIRHVFMSHP